MQIGQSKITSQGQVSVPAAVRNFLRLTPGSTLVWLQEGNRVVVERSTRHSTAEVHHALFCAAPAVDQVAKALDELKQGIRQRMQRRQPGG
ncbi:MAG: AbrB/MazE/SpoVT family DNA-binding domain-containing protein [Rubrivivax sp.]|nr:AbrB/MazE/SpoVT family DNA-binding domain-containing protein [Rubrivivax sp.]